MQDKRDTVVRWLSFCWTNWQNQLLLFFSAHVRRWLCIQNNCNDRVIIAVMESG